MDFGESFESSINRSDYTILVVDDVVSNVLLLKLLLTKENFKVLTANNGYTCIEIAQNNHPDLILLDVMMPDINGFETAEKLKSDPATADIPIIFLTALNAPSDLVKGFQVGANDFLTKPFNKEELVMRVMRQIQLVFAKRIIESQNAELKRTISNRDKMYSVIAHDLRSPMASIRMVLNLLVSTISSELIGEELFSLLDKANKESEETHDLLDNLLKWTKSQTGRLNVVHQNFDISDVFSLIAENKKQKINFDKQTGSIMVRADKDMLNTVLRNFMSNAIKFTPEGKDIDILVDKQDKFVKVSIRDHGVGISPERIATLFSAGQTTYGTNNEEGSGLGLQLCQDFARKNGGDVMVESVLGEGSTFSVFVPLMPEEA